MLPDKLHGEPPRVSLRVMRIVLGLVAVSALYLSVQNGWSPRVFSDARHQGPLDLADQDASRSVLALNSADRYHLLQQRSLVDELARRHVGTGIEGGSIRDLRVVQDLLDRGVLAPDQTYELQALGVVVGDVLAQQLGLDWVAVEDGYGRSRALAGENATTLLFPVTMISRRVEAGIEVDVRARYQEAESLVKPLTLEGPKRSG